MANSLVAREVRDSKLQEFDGLMGKAHSDYQMVLPSHMTPTRLSRMVKSAVNKAFDKNGNNRLLDADRYSLMNSIMTAAVFGLECDGALGQGHLVPFGGKVQFIVGYQGYITLAYNSGFVVTGHTIHEADIFSYQEGTQPQIQHAPPEIGAPRGEILGVYAVARAHGAPTVFKVMSFEKIKAIRDRSAGWRAAVNNMTKYKHEHPRSPWYTDFEPMAQKCPIRSLGKVMPLNVERENHFHQAASMDVAHDRGFISHVQPDGELNMPRDPVSE